MKRILFAIMLVLSLNVSACEINASGLTKEAMAELKVACEQAKLNAVKAASNPSTTKAEDFLTPERISAMGQISQDIAKAIGTAASSLGIAANEFLLTPAGMLVAAGIIAKLFLNQLVGVIGCILTVLSCVWWVRRAMVEEYVIVEKVRFKGLWTSTKRVPVFSTFKQMDENQGISIGIGVTIAAVFIWILVANLL